MAVTQFEANEIVSRANVNQRITQMNAYFPVSVTNGGTGGTTKTAARTNLEVLTAVVLYNNSSGTQGTVSLSDYTSGYSYLEIYYMDLDRTVSHYCVRVDSPRGLDVGLTGASYISGTSYNGYYAYTSQIHVSDTSLTWRSNKNGYFYNENGTRGDSPGNKISITRVVGYKY